MHKSKLKQLRLAVLLAWIPLSANAAGLGKLTVNSGLGEPLNAEIELVSTTPEEMSSLSARIAPEEAYSAQGIERVGIHNAIRVEVSKRAGTSVLKLISSQPVTDPFLDMLIQVDWATGRLVREYTVLLDPPGYSIEQTNNISVPQTSQTVTPSPVQATPEKVTPQAVAREVDKPAPTVTNDEYKTKRGDSLAKIAREMQVQDVSLDQMLVGLYRANKDAFDQDNMNQLKVGKILKVPTQAELLATTKQEASKEVRVQAADWNNYRNKLANVVQDSAKSDKSTVDSGANEAAIKPDSSASKGKISAPALDKAMPAEAASRDVVKLSKSEGDKKKSDADGAQAMKDKLNALQEEGVAREKSIKEANERANLLDKQVADLQKLLALKDKSLAEIQKNAEALKNQPKAEPAPATPVVAEKAPETAAPTPTPPAEVVSPPPVEQPAKPVEPEKVAAPAPAPVAAAPAVETSFFDEIDPVLLGGGLGGIALLGGAWAWLRNKRKRNLDNFEKGILTAGGLKANTVFGNTSGGTVDTGDTSFLTDFSQSVNGMIDTHDVDPIAEAEVYMAYGREAQAEEILNDAIAKDPTRYELHLKLLEIYGGRNDSSAFEAISGELYSTLGATHPVWAKVAELGRKMEPDNPLYDKPETTIEPQALASAVTNAASKLDEDVGSDADQILDIGDFGGAEASTDNGLDFSFSSDEESATQADPLSMLSEADPEEALVTSADDDSLDFDLETNAESEPGVFDLSNTDADSALEFNESSEVTDMSLDFPASSVEAVQEDSDLAMDFNLGDADAPAVTSEAESFDLSMPELELPDLSAQVDLPAEAGQLLTDDALSFDEPLAAVDAADATPLENVSEILESVGELDFNFDLDASSEAAPVLDITESVSVDELPEVSTEDDMSLASATAAPDIDLSEISLELDESANVEEISMSVTEESEDVNTKLDLVTAYIDMGDSEGARELLEEVIKEGGAGQRERAEKMLATLL